MSTDNNDSPGLDEAFENNDEITLAGIARQELDLYGDSPQEGPFRRLMNGLSAALGGKPQPKKSKKPSTRR